MWVRLQELPLGFHVPCSEQTTSGVPPTILYSTSVVPAPSHVAVPLNEQAIDGAVSP